MSRTSRVPHPPGSRFVSLYHWAVRRFGIGGAAVLGLLDFLDRAHDAPEQPLASRARIIADLEGLVGKHVVDRALQDLVAAGVIHRIEDTKMGRRNWETRVEYSLDITGLKRLLATPGTGSSGESRSRKPPALPKSELDPGLDPGVPTKRIDVKVEAAAHAHAHGAANAAAASTKTSKRRTRRPSGIVTWTPDDLPEAEQIEQQHSADVISAAAAELVAAGKEPVPGLIAREIDRQRRERDAADRRAVAEAAHQARLNTPPQQLDDKARARGLALLPPTLRARATHMETEHEQ